MFLTDSLENDSVACEQCGEDRRQRIVNWIVPVFTQTSTEV